MAIIDHSADLVSSARAVGPVIRLHADEAEQIRRLPAATVAALVDAGLMRMCVPAVYGGPEADPMTMIGAIEAVAHADGAAGWCTMIASTTSSLAAFLPADAAREIFANPHHVTGGVFAPNGTGICRDGGVEVTGRWQWGSGTQHCDWVLGGTACDDNTFRLCFTPVDTVVFHDTWITGGMRGTGSLDFSLDGVFVADDFTVQPAVTRPVIDTPLALFPNFTLLAVGVASVGLGVARRALDELAELAGSKKPQFSGRTLAAAPFTQVEFARAEASLRSARAFLFDEVGMAWERAVAGDAVDVETRVMIRLAAAHVASVSASVADTAFTLGGGAAVYDSSPLGRCLRDAHVVTQHIMTAPRLHELLGKSLLGGHIDASML